MKDLQISDGFNPLRSEIHRIIDATNRCLIDKGYGERRSAVRKRNYIDIREAVKGDSFSAIEEKANERLKEINPALFKSWLLCLPPFEHGTIQWADNKYVTWDMEDIDLDNRTYRYLLHYYYADEGLWRIGFITDVDAEIVDQDNEYGYVTSAEFVVSAFAEEAKALTLDDLKVYTDGYASDENVKKMLPIGEEVMFMPCKNETEVEDFMTDTFELVMHLFKYTNTLLAINGNKTERPKKARKKTAPSLEAGQVKEEPQDKRSERVINGISILSEKKPKAHTIESIRKYKCATWSVRAHSRTYKNGKVVFIKEQQRQRHNMNKTKANAKRIIFK